MLGANMKAADLSQYTEEEIQLAIKEHDEHCTPGCTYGPFLSFFDPNSWLEMAREQIARRPQKEVLF